jgi:hypothetical protein
MNFRKIKELIKKAWPFKYASHYDGTTTLPSRRDRTDRPKQFRLIKSNLMGLTTELRNYLLKNEDY